jgi:hypothetical protein
METATNHGAGADFGECELIFVAWIRGSGHGQERSQNYPEAPTMSICFLKRR